MVNENDNGDVQIDVTNDEDTEMDDIELEDIEDRGADKIKKLREQLKTAQEEKQQAHDDLQRARAEFLNARKRLDEERERDKVRHKIKHVEELLPLCDSFQMAMNDSAWEKADETWRKGIEGIHAQLMRTLKSYGVNVVNPVGEAFDPNKHEAVGTEPVTDKKLDDTVVSVMQHGYEITEDGKTEIIRPARVTTGQLTD